MRWMAIVPGIAVIAVILWDAFETVVLPRRVARQIRLARLYFQGSWRAWKAIGQRWRSGLRKENYLSLYAPLSLLLLLAIWAGGLIVGFALIQWGAASVGPAGRAAPGFATDVYLSATTFFTLGLGDVTPSSSGARLVTAVEAGTGFGFLALVIAYLPVLYQAFSRREVRISMLDEWAGSPPNAVELLRRAGKHDDVAAVDGLLKDWEQWAAELLESHLSYPILGYFRSQHDNQSWIAALAAILDAASLCLCGVEGVSARQARRTFAMARHAAVDLAQVFGTPPHPASVDRLPEDEAHALREMLEAAGVSLRTDAEHRLAALRGMYEPYLHALSDHLDMPVAPLIPGPSTPEDWRTSPWNSEGAREEFRGVE